MSLLYRFSCECKVPVHAKRQSGKEKSRLIPSICLVTFPVGGFSVNRPCQQVEGDPRAMMTVRG
jgi:hypothetical protein